MSTASYVLGVVAPALVLVIVIDLLRRGKLRERHAVWWFIFGVLALLGGIFPPFVESLAHITGVVLPINLVFFVALSVAFLVFLQHSSELTRLEAKTRSLAEKVALLELELRRQREASADDANPNGAPERGDAN